MRVTHKVMKVHAPFVGDRDARIEPIHQKCLTPADAAPQINAARWRWAQQPAMYRRAAAAMVDTPLFVALLQSLHSALLRRVVRKMALLQRVPVACEHAEWV